MAYDRASEIQSADGLNPAIRAVEAGKMSRMPGQIDDTDKAILACLRGDARTPVTALAKRVGLSRGAVQDRLGRLERDRVILGYTVRLRPPAETAVQAWLTIALTPGATCAAVAPALLAMTEVSACYALSGSIDMLAMVQAPTISALSALRETISALDGVAAVQTHTALAEHLAPA